MLRIHTHTHTVLGAFSLVRWWNYRKLILDPIWRIIVYIGPVRCNPTLPWPRIEFPLICLQPELQSSHVATVTPKLQQNHITSLVAMKYVLGHLEPLTAPLIMALPFSRPLSPRVIISGGPLTRWRPYIKPKACEGLAVHDKSDHNSCKQSLSVYRVHGWG